MKNRGRKEAKKRLPLTEMLEKAPYGVLLIDKDGKNLYVNEKFTEITGYDPEDVPTVREWALKGGVSKMGGRDVEERPEEQEGRQPRLHRDLQRRT